MPIRFNLFCTLILSLLGVLIYANSLNGDFVFDDYTSVIDNPVIKQIDLSALWNLNDRVFTNLTFALSYQFFHLNPSGYHLVNVVTHVLVVLTLFWFINLLVSTSTIIRENRSPRPEGRGSLFLAQNSPRQTWLVEFESTLHPWHECQGFFARNKISKLRNFPFYVALLFLVHPANTQAVNYISQRSALLSTLFYLLALVFYLKARLETKIFLFPCLFFAVLAFFSKEISFTLPLAIVLLEIYFFRSGIKKVLVSFWPFFLVALGVIFRLMDPFVYFEFFKWQYILTQFKVIVTYMRLLFFPFNLNADYDYPLSNSLFEPTTLLSFIFVILLIIFAVVIFNKYRLISFGIAFFLLALLVESLIPLDDVIFEHRLYLPAVGFSIFFVSSFYFLACWTGEKFRFISLKLTGVLTILFFGLIFVYSLAVISRNRVWQSELSLWSDVVNKSPLKARVHDGLGVAYLKQEQREDAVLEFNRAIQLDPGYFRAYNNLAVVYEREGNYDLAEAFYKKAIEGSSNNKASVRNLARLYSKLGRLGEASRLLEKL